MTFPVSQRRSPALTPRALASAISLCFIGSAPALAQGVTQILAPVVVTGARFASAPELAPIGAIVISADDIRRAGVSDVNQAIRKIGGVYGRQSFSGSPDFDLDLRGFGADSSQNLVVVLDGVRMSENELNPAILATIPIDNVERIEIMRGGSSVLYGEGATGGVINIVTKVPGKQGARGTLFAEAGQFQQREARASASQTWDGFALDASVGNQRADNYRDNNKFKQSNFSGGMQWMSKQDRIGMRVDSMRQDARFPGVLTLDQFEQNPRQSTKPNDFGSLDSDRVTAFMEHRVGSVDLAAELSHREKTSKGSYNSFSKQTQLSPRMRHLGKFDGLLNEVVVGVDLIHWNLVNDWDVATQKSKAVYVRDEIKFEGPQDARIAVGLRHESFDKDASAYSTKQSQNAWEVQGSYNVIPLLNLYAKTGQSYRVANADENGFTATNQPLKGQTSDDLELGATIGNAAQSVTARLFRHNLENEIFYDPTILNAFSGLGANTNLDPTRREGIEIDASTRITAHWRMSGHVQHVKATFTEGGNSGKEMVLVPKNIVSARLSWLPADGQSADIGAQWVDSQRNGGDFNNSCPARVPSFTTFDGRYARKFGAWEVALIGLNLTDKQYYTTAFYESFGPNCQTRIYPANGRQLKVSARYDF